MAAALAGAPDIDIPVAGSRLRAPEQPAAMHDKKASAIVERRIT
jgi:hypothetical protein